MATLKDRAPHSAKKTPAPAPKAAMPVKAKATSTPAPAPKAKPNGAGGAAVGTGVGVIAALIAKLRDGGGTQAELYDHLATLFPDRASAKAGMRNTIAIQLKRLPKTGKLAITSKDSDRGTVYRAAE